MSTEATERAAALAALLVGTPDEEGTAPTVTRTGNTVYAGGDVERLLIGPAHLSYPVTGGRQYVDAIVGDVVQLTGAEANRLDALGVTVDPATPDDTIVEDLTQGLYTDEQIRTASAADLVAYVAQHPDERARVRTIEEERGDKARTTVLDATRPTPVEDQEATTPTE